MAYVPFMEVGQNCVHDPFAGSSEIVIVSVSVFLTSRGVAVYSRQIS